MISSILSSLVIGTMAMMAVVCSVEAYHYRGDGSLRQIALVHRHGARQPGVVDPTTEEVSWDNSQLTDVGIDMLHQLGQYVRTTYGPALDIKAYNVERYKSRSSFSDRTLQSGMAMLLGMFPDRAAPVITYEPRATDYVLHVNGLPTYKMNDPTDSVVALVNKLVPTLLTPEQLAAIGAALKVPHMCNNSESLAWCVAYAQDTAKCNLANAGECGGASYCEPGFLAVLDKLNSFYNHHTVVQLPDETFQKAAFGSLGAFLLRDIVSNFESDSAKNAGPSVAMRHYSAHDTTLTALYHALGVLRPGDESNPKNMPVFGETVIFELYTNATVRVRVGAPNQTFGSDHGYTFSDLPIKCNCSGDGDLSDECDFLSWKTAVMNKWPEPDACYVYEPIFTATGCSNLTVPTTNKKCSRFRAACPIAACGGASSGLLMNTTTPGMPCAP
eukprot:PhM_4_TR8731/c0_g1_i2/m.70975